MFRATSGAALLTAAALLAGCGSSPEPHSVAVFAAASLRSTFTDLSGAFTGANTGAKVELTFAGSADLLTQLTQGAHGDVFASADAKTMDKAAAAGLLAGAPKPFASNTLTIVVAKGNPKAIKGFRDLTGVTLVTCAAQVPCGSALPRIQQETGVRFTPASEEPSVTDVLNKVTSGQADAGIVYITDARSAGDKVSAVAFPEAARAVNTYEIAVLKGSSDATLAGRFVDLVTGPAGQQALRAAGFGPP
jgi:molybdate transport system substrate-binding protein